MELTKMPSLSQEKLPLISRTTMRKQHSDSTYRDSNRLRKNKHQVSFLNHLYRETGG